MNARLEIELVLTFCNARIDAARRQHTQLTPEHALLALCSNTQGISMLAHAGVDIDALKADLHNRLDAMTDIVDKNMRLTSGIPDAPETKRIFAAAANHMPKDRAFNLNGAFYVAALADGDTPVAALLRKHGLDAQTAQKALDAVTAIYTPSLLESMSLKAQ